ncbi:MAG: oligosaccharide flippase family protein [Elusimicrobia bacterium]|nr:oligosaccharide flippase family protein [Elusimicrobiota bacterium]
MFSEIKKLGKESLVYGLSTVASRLLTFLLLPFYTHYLSPADYGVVAAVFSYIAFFNILCQYGLDQAYMRHYEEREKAFPSAFWGVAAVSFVITVVLCAGRQPLALAAGIGAGRGRLVAYSAIILFADALSAVPFADLRMAHKALKYALIRFSAVILNLLLNFWFIARSGWGIEGIFAANIVSSLFTLAIVLWPALPRLKLRLDMPVFRKMLSFALPLVPAGLGAMAVQVIDRPILLRLSGETTVGIYQANYRLGIFMMLVVSMFDQAWRPFFIERAKNPEAKPLFAGILTYFSMGSAWLVLALSFFIEDLVKIRVAGRTLIHPAYWPGLGIVPVVLWGYLFNGLYVNFLAPAVIAKKTGRIMAATLFGAALNIAANFLLIPPFGMLGAAWATFIAYFSMAVFMHQAGRKYYIVPYDYKRVAGVLGIAGVGACVVFLKPLIGPGAWLAVRLAALGAYSAAVFFLLLPDEQKAFKGLFDRISPPSAFSLKS